MRLAGIDERERQSNRDVFGRACFFGSGLSFRWLSDGFYITPGVAYLEGIRVVLAEPFPVTGIVITDTIWLDVCLERQASDTVTSWKVKSGNHTDYIDSAGARHYCVPIAKVVSSTQVDDLRTVEPINGALVTHFAARTGDYPNLRARGTTKDDVGLGQIPNAKSDDPATNSSEILATTAALNKLNQMIGEPLVGMVASFAMSAVPSGWLRCNGAAVSRTTFAKLFTRVGTTFGGGDGSTTFNLPDMRGLFPRGWDEGRGIDGGRPFGSHQDHMMLSHHHSAWSAAAGDHIHSAWTDAQGEHSHSAWSDVQGNHAHQVKEGHAQPGGNDEVMASGDDYTRTIAHWSTSSAAGAHSHNIGVSSAGNHGHNIGVGWAGNHSHAVTVDPNGGHENRPKNIALLYCIKF